MRSRLLLHVHCEVGKRFDAMLKTQIPAACLLLQNGLKELSIALVGDRTMSRLHQQFMSIDAPTDVLTFPLDLDARGRIVGGEIVVCVAAARRSARLRDIKIENEILLYAIHGLLHLSGYDDRTKSGFDRMHREEDRILVRLGVGTVFARPLEPRRGPRSGVCR